MTEPIWAWAVFLLVVFVMLMVDLGVFHRKAHVLSMEEAAIWSTVWVVVSLVFNAVVWVWLGHQRALEFFTGYLVEKALSADNIFVFAVLFNYFAVPPEYRHRVLFWGVLGAIVFRLTFILAGTALLKKFHWVVYIFGIIVIVSGIKLLMRKEEEIHPERNPVLRLARRFLPITPNYHGQKFFVRLDGKFMATPLMLVLLVVESTDIVFAIDSIPAIFAITRDPFIVFTSNVCAILGLRALYFLLEGMIRLFRYLDEGLAVILVFIGIKMLVSEFYKIPTWVALGFVAAVLAITIVSSLIAERKEKVEAEGLEVQFNPNPEGRGKDKSSREEKP
ncbi:TerC family protein [Fervidibacter sacchari]|uniref:Tellurite resistance protein TerC n=1 Tax=Candidatus Fervidibacter sacchari TaxID=1448929 RepID=A0ABT2ENK7_9BACT|nr:TerC family protein [Candidatus Fervidibacter sacchari]MCS3919535.1 tellurite resistance protein TerC [Candidatus Fervidibacter sacchari]WKU15259.1 TerC family protein [Candidatus Fervidibacter sacchari]